MNVTAPLRVGFDVAPLSNPNLTGIPMYVESLLRQYLDGTQGAGDDRYYLVGSQWGIDLRALLIERGVVGAESVDIVPAAEFRIGPRFPRIRDANGLEWFLRKWDGRVGIPMNNYVMSRRLGCPFDVFHHTGFVKLLPSGARRHIVTIYDLTTRFFPEMHTAVNIAEWDRVFAFARDRADRVITDSESARRDVIEHLGIAPDRVTAIPLGLRQLPSVSEAEREEIIARCDLSGHRFVLSVGSLDPRKNLPRLIEAFGRLCREPGMDDVLLTLTGARWHGAEAVDAAIARHGLAGKVRLTGYVSDIDLVALLQTCDVFAYPSLYEGFGLPVLEAMALGAPVVTSDRSSLPEVAGDAALLINPEDIDSIADGIRRVLTDSALSAILRALGPARAARFTWKGAAEAHRRVYHEVCAAS